MTTCNCIQSVCHEKMNGQQLPRSTGLYLHVQDTPLNTSLRRPFLKSFKEWWTGSSFICHYPCLCRRSEISLLCIFLGRSFIPTQKGNMSIPTTVLSTSVHQSFRIDPKTYTYCRMRGTYRTLSEIFIHTFLKLRQLKCNNTIPFY